MSFAKLQKLGFWLLGLAILAVVAVSVAVSFLDWNKYRQTLSELASEQMDMRVDLAGNVSVSLFPRPSVAAETVRIAPTGAGNSEIIATADKISLRLGMEDVLKGAVAIQSLALEGLKVRLAEDVAGNWRVQGWPEGDTGGQVDLRRLDIENGSVSFVPYDGEERLVEHLNLRIDGEMPAGRLAWDGDFDLEEQTVRTKGRLKPISTRDETSIKAELVMAGGTLTASGRLASGGDLTARMTMLGPDMGKTLRALATVLGSKDDFVAPSIPYSVDLQIDMKGGISKVVSRQMMLGDTRGRIDLTLAQKSDVHHVAGSISLGVIDLAAWRSDAVVPIKKVEGGVDLDTEQPLKLSGEVDVTIEGVQLNAGLGQRIDTIVAFRPDGPRITSLQALLPGAASLAVQGEFGLENGNGTFLLNAGNLPDLAIWLGSRLPDGLPDGRLNTANIRGNMDYRNGVWALTAMTGAFDVTKVAGEVSGEMSSVKPTHLKLALDKLDLDVFLGGGKVGAESLPRIPSGHDVALDLQVDALNGFGSNLGEARFVGTLKPGALEIDFLSLARGEQRLQLEGQVSNTPDDLALELGADFKNWPMLISRHFAGGLSETLVAAGMEELTGTASASGNLSRMRMGFEATSSGQDVNLSGELGFPENRLTFVELQGGLKHKNVAGVVRNLGLGDFNDLPVQVTYSLSKKGPGEPFRAKVGGDFAGGKLQAGIENGDVLEKVALTYDHENLRQLKASLGDVPFGLDVSHSLRGAVEFNRVDQGWAVNVSRIKNGDTTVSGTLQASGDRELNGRLLVSNLELLSGSNEGSISGPSLSAGFIAPLASYSGRVDVGLVDFVVAGQKLSAPNVVFSVEAGRGVLDLGENAMLNGGASKGRVDISLGDAVKFDADIEFAALDLASALVSSGLSDVMSSTVAGELRLSGEFGGRVPVLSTLSGNGSFSGQAGQLKFLSVNGLMSSLQTERSGQGFLATVGHLLRSGQTPITSLEGSFTLDGGVMLLETVEAKGAWGDFDLDGQVNLSDRFVSLKGQLALNTPPDIPAIPVTYEGNIDSPSATWSSRLFERFALAGIERRLRTELFREMEERSETQGESMRNPGLAVFTRAFGLLGDLKAKQEEQRRLEAEAKRKAEEAAAKLSQGPGE